MAYVTGYVEESNMLSTLDRNLLFVIHNLRPTRRNGKKLISLTCNETDYPPGSEECQLDRNIENDLKKVWPNLNDLGNPTEHWEKQWGIHGRAAGMPNSTYWPKAAELAQPFTTPDHEDYVIAKLNERGIKIGEKVSLVKFMKAMEHIVGVPIRVNLREKNGQHYLKEIIVLLDKSFSRVPHIDAVAKKGNIEFFFEDIDMRLKRERQERKRGGAPIA